jgi:hypothetical protein
MEKQDREISSELRELFRKHFRESLLHGSALSTKISSFHEPQARALRAPRFAFAPNVCHA